MLLTHDEAVSVTRMRPASALRFLKDFGATKKGNVWVLDGYWFRPDLFGKFVIVKRRTK
jgi:hypothetical protein